MKRIIAVMCTAVLASQLCGCTEYWKNDAVYDNTLFYISDSGKKAFASEYMWDLNPEHTDIYIPDTVDGAEVRALGGFIGSGAPAPFEIVPGNTDYIRASGTIDPEIYGCPAFWDDLEFTVHIGKNVTEFAGSAESGYYGIRDEYGNLIFYHPVCRFECDPENRTFYSEDGILYEKKSGTVPSAEEKLLPTGEYGPEFAGLSFPKKLEGRYTYERQNGSMTVVEAVYDIGVIMLNIGEYRSGRLYSSYGAAVFPTDASGWTVPQNDSFEVDVYRFDESNDPLKDMEFFVRPHAVYTMTVTEDDLRFSQWDGNGIPVLEGTDNVILKRDHYAPSQFPVHPSDTDFLFADGEKRTGFTANDELISGFWQTSSYILEVTPDQTMNLYMKDTFVPSGYRGICSTGSDGDLRFVLSKYGGGTKQYSGRIHYEPGSTIPIITVDGYDSDPLIPQQYYKSDEMFPLELH